MESVSSTGRPLGRMWIAAAAVLALGASVYAQQAPDINAGKESQSKDSQVSPPTPPPMTAPTPEDRAGAALSFTGGVDFASHFISFGADVWGGGNNASPFSSRSVYFAHGTLTGKFTDSFSGFVNIWSDLNDNVDSPIGGPIQEIDLNIGLNYTVGPLTFGATYAYWQFGGGSEKAVEGSVSYNDSAMWEDSYKGFAINPSVLVHYRFDEDGDLHAESHAAVIQAGVAPAYTFSPISTDYPITVSLPANVGYFTDPYQGGDGAGFGYIDAGISATVPLAFIPKKFGNWTASISEIYYYTFENDIPTNPNQNFIVSTLSVGVAF